MIGRPRHERCERLIEAAAVVRRELGICPVRKRYWQRRYDLALDALSLHLGQAGVAVPVTSRDLSVYGAALPDRRPGRRFGPENGPPAVGRLAGEVREADRIQMC